MRAPIEQARGKALTDLVTGNANVDVQIVLTVPADDASAPVASAVAAASAHQRARGAEHIDEPAAVTLGPGRDPVTDDDLLGVQGQQAVRAGAGSPQPPTCSPCADATTGSSSGPDGDDAGRGTALPRGPTPPAGFEPPRRWTR